MRDKCITYSIAVLLLLLLVVPASAETNLVQNPSFEEPTETNAIPGWEVFAGRIGTSIVVEADATAIHGKHSLVLYDNSSSGSFGLRSNPVPATPGEVYEASVFVYCPPNTKAQLYLDFWHAGRKRTSSKHVISSTTGAWEELKVSLAAPQDAAYVSVILYSTPTYIGEPRFDQVSLYNVAQRLAHAMSAEDEFELVANDEILDYAPANLSVVSSNPPAFIWIPISGVATYTVECSTDPNFAPEATHKFAGIDLSVYRPSIILDADKTWYWRVHGVYKNGSTTPPTGTRSFRIAQDAALMPLPDLDEVKARVPDHPRLYVTPQTLPQWQAAKETVMLNKVLWQSLYNEAIIALFEPLTAEPPNCRPNGVFDSVIWGEANRMTNRAIGTMELLAFVYLMTDDARFGEAARKWMLHIASWDPEGTTSARSNSDSSRPIIQKMGRAYTWAYTALTPEDRDVIQNVIQIRGTEAYMILRNRPYESRPYASHATGSLSLIGEAAIAFLGEIPEAEEWFDYLVRIYYSVYPPWGGDSGGWAEGNAYWNASVSKALWFADALKAATSLDLYQMPFYKNTGDFKLYTQPPYSKLGPFGDFATSAPTSGSSANMGHLAVVYQNPYYKWYAQTLGMTVETGLPGFIRANLYDQLSVKAQPPVDAATGVHYPEIGWVIFHRDYMAPQNERIQFSFKSSPYGSYSHSMADQNSFTLEAYGAPLAISSGYRPWYGSPHHMGWTKTTQAQNTILVNGQGQIMQSLEAKGDIVGYVNGKSFSYTTGVAHTAYKSNLLQKFARHVVYLRPDLFVIYDDLQAPQPSTFSWLFHAYQQMEIDPAGQGFALQAPGANLQVKLWSNTPLAFSQTDQFAVPLDDDVIRPVQWHLTASSQTKVQEAYFLAVLEPLLQDTQSKVHLEQLVMENGEGVLISDDEQSSVVLFRRGRGQLSAAGLVANGTVAAWQDLAHGTQGLLLADGTVWQADSGIKLASDTMLSAEFTIAKHELSGTLITDAGPGSTPFTVTLHIPGAKVAALNSSHTVISWQATGNTVTMTLEPGEHQLTLTLE